ncbi:MAG: LppX_LprAFG lipoprotein [Chloroflexi bacterium]|uniref:LppX_LprAFG lipoprotein n=1 Tax=Candidatus Chlorohelix allophototropha TaxID=3003348 RepID=A0A8T7LXU4_9CHLR|nr:LppX_LprAFG lipoprotein [Chloroflexota bacterium]WJW67659.1 LppX_LprAFG lipoprotein [Chloroflexota bacterium L227-S17]
MRCIKASFSESRVPFVLLFTLVFSFILAACGETTPTALPLPDPKVLAKQAADKLYGVNFVHFLVDIKQGEVPIVTGISFRRAEGDYVKPDSYKATLRVSVVLGQVEATTIALGNEQWILVKGLNDKWQPLPAGVGFKAAELFDSQRGLGAIVQKAQNLAITGTETIDGAESWKLSGTIQGKELETFTAGTLNNSDVNFDIWVSKSDTLLRQAILKEVTQDPAKGVTWQMNFSKFNETVTVQRPPGV